jgi:hypothetical protein
MRVSASQCPPHASGKLEVVLDFAKLQDCDSLSDEQGELRVLASGEIKPVISFGTSSEKTFESSNSDFSEDDNFAVFEKRLGARARMAPVSQRRIQGRMFACLRREQL